MKWKNKINIKDVIGTNFKMTTITGGFGPVDPFSASIWKEKGIEVWLKTQNYPETLWGKDAEDFMEFYNENK